jgi:hypothetical protein
MILLAQAVPLVQVDDLLLVEFQTGPPPFQLNFRDEQRLSFLVNGALSYSHHTTEGEGLLNTVFIDNSLFLFHAEKSHPFTDEMVSPR